MTNQATQYLALDVHQATVVASLRSAEGSIRMRATVPTEARAIVNLVRGIGPKVHVALEEGTQAQWLHDLIAAIAESVVVCNTRGRSEVENKSDRIDADRLSELLRLGAIKPVFHAAQDTLCLKELVRDYLQPGRRCCSNQSPDQIDVPRPRYRHARSIGVRARTA